MPVRTVFWCIVATVGIDQQVSVVDPVMIFSDPDLDPTSQLVSDPTLIFSNILNINFTFVFPSPKSVRLHIMI